MSPFSSDRRRFVERSASIVGGFALLGHPGLDRLSSDHTEATQTAHPRRADLEARVIARAWKDDRYRAALVRNPRSVLSEALRASVPSGLRIEVLQERPDHVYFVLPVDPAATTHKEISPQEMDILAMGVTVKTQCAIPSTVMVPAWFQSMGMYGGAG